MCIAIAKPAGSVISRETLKTCQEANRDGQGFALVDDNKNIIIYKNMAFDPFYEEYEKMTERYPNSPFLIHFRIKTHGTTDVFNCHPFRINKHMAFIHNGIIRHVPDCPDKKRNDTQMFNELVLQKLPKGWDKNPAVDALIEEYIGYSKIALLTTDNGGTLKIYNKDKGEMDGDIWYSNSSYKTKKTYQYSGHRSYLGSDGYGSDDYGYGSYGTYYSTGARKYCKECNKDITHNAYSNAQKKDFCTIACEDKWNDKQAEQSVLGAKVGECDWCSGDKPQEILFTFKPFEGQSDPVVLCHTCLREAINCNYTKSTPEIVKHLEAADEFVDKHCCAYCGGRMEKVFITSFSGSAKGVRFCDWKCEREWNKMRRAELKLITGGK